MQEEFPVALEPFTISLSDAQGMTWNKDCVTNIYVMSFLRTRKLVRIFY
jgi:hypothetical protein